MRCTFAVIVTRWLSSTFLQGKDLAQGEGEGEGEGEEEGEGDGEKEGEGKGTDRRVSADR